MHATFWHEQWLSSQNDVTINNVTQLRTTQSAEPCSRAPNNKYSVRCCTHSHILTMAPSECSTGCTSMRLSRSEFIAGCSNSMTWTFVWIPPTTSQWHCADDVIMTDMCIAFFSFLCRQAAADESSAEVIVFVLMLLLFFLCFAVGDGTGCSKPVTTQTVLLTSLLSCVYVYYNNRIIVMRFGLYIIAD